MKILILAGGYGTRLYPLIKDTPKALLDIAGKPLIDYTVEKIKDFKDLTEILVVTNHKFYKHFLKWAKNLKGISAKITIVNDGTKTPDDRLGSIGDIHFVLKNCKIKEDLLVLGSDNLFDYTLDGYVKFAQAKSPAVNVGFEAKKFGVAEIDKNGKIVSFQEKPETPRSSLIAMCCYYLPAASLKLIEQYLEETKKADKAGEYIKWLSEKQSVYGFKFEGRWFDIGSIESYHEAQKAFSR